MEQKLSDILDNVLGLLLLEGSYEIQEIEGGFHVSIETKDAGRLIGFKGESLQSLQLLVSQMANKGIKEGEPALSDPPAGGESNGFKRVILDVEGWRKNKEEELVGRTKDWVEEVKESGKEMELEPMPSWQRRIVHMGVSEIEGVESESVGEGRDRHLVIRPTVLVKPLANS